MIFLGFHFFRYETCDADSCILAQQYETNEYGCCLTISNATAVPMPKAKVQVTVNVPEKSKVTTHTEARVQGPPDVPAPMPTFQPDFSAEMSQLEAGARSAVSKNVARKLTKTSQAPAVDTQLFQEITD